jgi:hypothetical protein
MSKRYAVIKFSLTSALVLTIGRRCVSRFFGQTHSSGTNCMATKTWHVTLVRCMFPQRDTKETASGRTERAIFNQARDPERGVKASAVTTCSTGSGANNSSDHRGNLLGTVRGLLLDSAPFRQISLNRELSIVWTSNGPLVYQSRSNNEI